MTKNTIDLSCAKKTILAIAKYSEPADHDVLDRILSKGRTKYNYSTGVAIPFNGVSLIYSLSEDQAAYALFIDITRKFKSNLLSKHIVNEMAFVDHKYLHVTTFDLINEKQIPPDYLSNYSDIKKRVITKVTQYVKNDPVEFNITVRLNGISMYAPHVIIFDLAVIHGMGSLLDYRKNLCGYLRNELPDIEPLCSKSWGAQYHPHITLSYIVNPFTKLKAESMFEIIEKLNAKFFPIEFDMNLGRVTEFMDMDQYRAIGDIENIRLSNGSS